MNLSNKAILEVQNLARRAESLAAGTASERKQADVLIARIKVLREAGLSSDEIREKYTFALCESQGIDQSEKREFRKALRSFFSIRPAEEVRDLIGGTQALSYTYGSQGGYLVAPQFHRELMLGLKQVDPLLDPEIVNLIETEKGGVLPLPMWDLSSISAQIVGEATTLDPDGTVPAASVLELNGFTYRSNPIRASFELEEDAFEPALELLKKAFTAGLLRRIGSDLVLGSGTGTPQGVYTGSASSGYTTVTSGVITNADIQAIYFSLNRAYRNNPKTAWLMSDDVYQIARLAKDTNGRPLLNVVDDEERLMGKPVYISPSMPSLISSPATNGAIVFGDLSYYAVRVIGQVAIRRNLQTKYVEQGQALYTALLRVDAGVLTPASGSPAIISASVKV